MPSLYESVANEVMYKANIAPTPPNTEYMRENSKVLSGIGYFKDLYLNRNQTRNFDDKLTNYFRKNESERKDLGYTLAQSILHRTAQNPSKN